MTNAANTAHTAPDRVSTAIEACSGKFGLGIVSLTNFSDLQDQQTSTSSRDISETFQQRIASVLRPSDQMLVLADDTVCVVIDELIDSNHLHLAGIKIVRVFETPMEATGTSAVMAVHCGLVYAGRYTRASRTAAELYQLAEEACFTSIVSKKSFEIVNATDDQPMDSDWLLNQRVQAAMENHHISYDYQPKIDLSSGDLVGGEALIRWRDNGRIIPPDEYLVTLTDEVLWKVTIYGYRRVLREILDHEIKVPISYNIDPSSLAQPDFLDFMRRETKLWGVPATQIILEITETNELLDLTRSKALLESIRASGFRISLDDFGTGHSNMQRISALPLDEIKLDRGLCSNVLHDADARQITQSIVNLARTLKILTVAEGIEDAETMALLAEIGCDMGQGFYLGAPTSVEDFASL